MHTHTLTLYNLTNQQFEIQSVAVNLCHAKLMFRRIISYCIHLHIFKFVCIWVFFCFNGMLCCLRHDYGIANSQLRHDAWKMQRLDYKIKVSSA